MSDQPQPRRAVCEWCGDDFVAPSARGPLPRFCRPAHRQSAYVRRAKSASPGAGASARVERLESALQLATQAKTWAAARSVIATALRTHTADRA